MRFLARGVVGGWLAALLVAGGAGGMGCSTRPDRERSAAHEPAASGWTVRQGQAVWQPSRRGAELAGDLTVATGGPGEYLIEFTKPAMTLVRVLRKDGCWEVSATGRGHWSGHGRAPRRSWFELGAFLSGAPVDAPWHGEHTGTNGEWSLVNPATGERLEGYLAP